MFCNYATTVSAHPWNFCNRSIRAELEAVATDYPPRLVSGVMTTYVQAVSLGNVLVDGVSVPIRGVRVGRLHVGGTPVPQVVVYGGQHAREWATTEAVMRAMRWFASSFRDDTNGVRSLLADRAILFVPVVNIAGYARTHQGTSASDTHRLWRPNFTSCGVSPSGTDLNRNAALTHDHPGASDACSDSPGSTFRGPGPSSETETQHLLGAFGPASQYRTVLAVNTHAYGNYLMFTEGLSTTLVGSPPNVTFSPCGTNSNCTAPDLGLVYRIAGTDRVPRMRDEEVPSVAYRVGSTFRTLYAVSGDTATETVYGTLPGAVPRFMSVSAELTQTACGFYAERIPPAQMAALAANFQTFVKEVTDPADELASGAPSTVLADFDLPLVERRALAGVAGERPRWRIAARSALSGVTLTPVGGGSGTTSVDDVRPGVFYRLHRFTPTNPYVVPGRLRACATGVQCRTMGMGGATGPVDLCSSGWLSGGAGWTWKPWISGAVQAQCYWQFAASSSSALTGIPLDLTHLAQSRLVFSYRWRRSKVKGRVELSANGFVGCSATNYGNCRILDRFEQDNPAHVEVRDDAYRTAVFDVADFDGKTNVRIRFVAEGVSIWSPPVAGDFDVFNPVIVGWYTGP